MSTEEQEKIEEPVQTTFFVIERGFKEGKQLTQAQKSSALFSEEPVVMGRTLRRGSTSMKISSADYRANEPRLLQLEKAGAIKITRPEKTMKPCELCGQTPRGQAGKFKCPSCGLPTVMNLEISAPPADPPAVIVPPPPPSVPAPTTPEEAANGGKTPAEEPVVEEKKEEVTPVSEKPKSSKSKR